MESLRKAAEWAGEKISEGGEYIQETFKAEPTAEGAKENVTEGMKQTGEGIKEGAEAAKKNVSEGLEDTKSNIQQKGEDIKEKGQELKEKWSKE